MRRWEELTATKRVKYIIGKIQNENVKPETVDRFKKLVNFVWKIKLNIKKKKNNN